MNLKEFLLLKSKVPRGKVEKRVTVKKNLKEERLGKYLLHKGSTREKKLRKTFFRPETRMNISSSGKRTELKIVALI